MPHAHPAPPPAFGFTLPYINTERKENLVYFLADFSYIW